jgi:hypothetical protein
MRSFDPIGKSDQDSAFLLSALFRRTGASPASNSTTDREHFQEKWTRLSVRKCDNARKLERFLSPINVKPLLDQCGGEGEACPSHCQNA